MAAGLLADRVVFVTGGSRGIGAAACELMARYGAAVGVNYRTSADRAEEVVARIERDGGRALAVRGDVADREQMARAMDAVRAAFGPINTLVLNASGHSGQFSPRPLVGQSVQGVETLVGEQIRAVLVPCQIALRDMAESGLGCVTVVGSGMSETPVPGFGSLGVAKAAADALVRSLAVELADMTKII